MGALFDVRPIDGASVRAAYAVMLLAMPELNFQTFKKSVGTGRLSTRSGTLNGIFDRRDYVHGLFRASINPMVSGGHRLKISDLLLSDTISTGLLSQMIDALEIFARAVGCDQLTIEAARGDAPHGMPLSNVLVMRGFSGESLLMARRI